MLKYVLILLLAPWASSQVLASVADGGGEWLERLRSCRDVQESLARLQCYDKVTSGLEEEYEEPARVAGHPEPAGVPGHPEPAGVPSHPEPAGVPSHPGPAGADRVEEPAPPAGEPTATTETTPAEPAPPTGKWVLVTENNPLDGTTTTRATLPAVEDRSGPRRGIALVLQCRSDQTSLLIDWGEYLREASPSVTTRVDSRPQVTAEWTRSPDKRATIYSPPGTRKREERTKSFALELRTARKLAARVVPHKGSSITAVFELEGVEAAVRSVRRACGW